jgi:serine/threonine-protein kinase
MAPERILGNDAGGPSDLYALGVVFFEMLAGELPFDAPDVTTFFVKHMNEPAPSVRSRNAHVPPALDELVGKLLEKDPNNRPVDAHRIHQDLLQLLREREVAAPPTTEAEPPSVAAPVTLAAGASDLWGRRIFVLERMLARAFGAKQSAPGELTGLLDEVNVLVRKGVALRTESIEAQQALEEIDLRGREKRAQLGFAVDQLGVDGSKTKEELRAAHELVERADDECARARGRFEVAHKEVVIWEGRSGFLEPWPDLAQAYRGVADVVDEWNAYRGEQRRAQEHAAVAERNANDLDFQIRELRAALATHEQELDAEREKCRARIQSNGNATDAIETQLLELTTRFCQPLRTRPELAPLFKELEIEAAA